jgi:hypothetical protein
MERGSVTRSNFASQNAPGTVFATSNAQALRVTDPRSERQAFHTMARANFDLPDFFVSLAGNHLRN